MFPCLRFFEPSTMPYSLLLASQRSGTNYLRSLLGSHPEVAGNLGEIFHDTPAEHRKPYNFWHYLHGLPAPELPEAIPSHRSKSFPGFLDSLNARLPGQTIILDVKYNSMHHLNTAWAFPHCEPELLKTARELDMTVLHVRRRNVLRQVISRMRADAVKQHIIKDDALNRTASIPVNPHHVQHEIHSTVFMQNMVSNWLGNQPHAMEIAYEDLWEGAPGETRNLDLERRILEFLGVNPSAELKPGTRKMTPNDLSEAIANLDEVRNFLADTEFAWMLDD